MTFFFTNSSEILVPPLPSLRLDEKKLESYLRSQPNLNIGSSDHLHIMQFKYGQSNPTYLITLGGFKCVLRKSPPGKLLKGAHQVEREAKIMHQMHGFIPVPQIHHICNDDTVIGTPFYLMEHIQGVIYKDPSLPSLSPEDRTKVYSTFCETLAKIHSIRPEQLGLTHMAYFNRYCSRQIKIWSGQYERSCQDPVRGDPNMDRLSTWLLQHVPPGDTEGMYGGSGPRIIHGDYRLDNVIFDASDPSRILAVLDWELSSIGDVFTDLAHACMPYHLPPVGILTGLSLRKRERKQSGDNNAYVSTKDDFVVGVPSESQFLEQYFIFRQRMEEERNNIHNHSHRHTTMSLSSSSFVLHHWSFYTVLALYRSCSILFGVYSRLLQGNAASSSQTADGDCSNRNESHGGGSHGRELQRIIPAITTTAIAIIDADSIPSPNTGRLTRAASMSTDSTVTGSGTGTGKPGLQPSSRGQALLQRLKEFINKEMLPIETELLQYYTVAEGKWPERGDRWVIHPLLESLTRCARETGLWNLWMPSTLYEQLLAAHPHWDWDSLLPHRKETVQRGQSRKAFKTTLLHLGGNAERLALAEVSLQQARLAVLQAALELDNSDLLGHDLSPAAMHALAIAKIAAPQAAQTCLDLAIQLHGAEGLSSSTPLAAMWAAARAIRIVDGADEVHIRTLVRLGMAAASDKEKAKGRVSRL
eukprot:gene1332-2573_t